MPTKPAVLSRKAALAKGAIMVFLRPKLAQDARLDLNPLLVGITNDNFGAKKGKLGEDLKTSLKGKLATDASLDDVTQLLDALEEVEEIEGIDAPVLDPNAALPIHKDEEGGKAREFLAGKLSAEDMATYDAMMVPPKANDAEEDEEERKKREAEDAEEKEEKVTKSAMDEAIKSASTKAAKDAEASTIARLNAVREAERIVKPYIGDLAIAQDTAEGVYKLALDHMGVDLKDVPPSAYRAVLKTIPIPGSKKTTVVAQDAAGATDFAARYPEAVRINNLG